MFSPTQHMVLKYLLLATGLGRIDHLQANLQNLKVLTMLKC